MIVTQSSRQSRQSRIGKVEPTWSTRANCLTASWAPHTCCWETIRAALIDPHFDSLISQRFLWNSGHTDLQNGAKERLENMTITCLSKLFCIKDGEVKAWSLKASCRAGFGNIRGLDRGAVTSIDLLICCRDRLVNTQNTLKRTRVPISRARQAKLK